MARRCIDSQVYYRMSYFSLQWSSRVLSLGTVAIALAVLTIRPTVHAARPEAGQAAQREAGSTGASSGRPATDEPRWGNLVVEPIVISPPLEYIPVEDPPARPPRWFFPTESADELFAMLSGAGFAPAEAARLRQAAVASTAGARGFVISPSPDYVRGLDTRVRARLYRLLARSPENVAQQTAYRYYGDSVDTWLGPDLPARIRALVDPLVYRDEDFLFFADLELVRAEIGAGRDLQLLVKRLLSQATAMVRLRVEPGARVDDLVEYWGRGGRKTDIRPLLESIGSGPEARTVDISHLLPELPRRLLYRYPKVTLADLAKPQLANCFWTALNFFASEPDDRLLDPATAMEHLRREYYLVQDELQLGDIVAFSDRNLKMFHVAVYVADDLVFTKNGYFSLAPWTILPMERLKGHFAEHRDDWRVTYYRRSDF
jgi:hypothetical protein